MTLRGPNGTLTVPEGVMIADRHIHMTPAQAAAFGLADGDRVKVKIDGPKPGVMGGVLIRANDKCARIFTSTRMTAMPSCSSRGSWSPCWAKRSKL